jgi:hypothetical protein
MWTNSVSATTKDALWRCVGADGKEVYADQKQGLKDCQKYDVKTDARPPTKQSDAEVKSETPPQNTALPKERGTSETATTGLMDFGTFNRLSLGMSEAEVLNLAGAPKSRLTAAWLYSHPDASIIELRFGSGRIVEIRRYQSPQ